MSDDTDSWAKARADMVATQLKARGIADKRVLEAMGKIPRHLFVPEDMQPLAYDDGALPIGEGQTISQPYIVARMLELLSLKRRDRVLEVGTGSGYGAAVLGHLVERVVTMERLPHLARAARGRFSNLDMDNVTVITGDGTLGYPLKAPYDAILVSAGGPSVPKALTDQLAPGGRLMIPVGAAEFLQNLLLIERHGAELRTTVHEAVRFVPLIGEQGW
ncbi:protein-L-isoaspartate(D-aspartate) O-methyltransferase [Govanella unica]|uniref:Protein-L-isoaspartate O-methyltransferase n=1 Tax=Govanella unica TaxID=2975056 RepID=A0A9X3TZV5_9PROT|nr:protein-L-isoaspartate(D-aspartate) O-methyltransferase [Govania unica]MDA5194834.1 protein-L-isoaspartate(D-aspartate) O-methyltransferase [Govania unica]